nr:MAG: RNA-dependent RNA polymerase [Porcine picobirnavirus]
MHIEKRFDLNEFADLPNPGLNSYFSVTKNGNTEEYRTPFYKGTDLQTVVDNWVSELEPLKKQWPGMYEFEMDLRKKVGPLSIQLPLSERLDDIKAYYEGILLPSEEIDSRAVSAAIKFFQGTRALNVRGERATLDKMKLSTSSGLPYFTRKRNVLGKTIGYELDYPYQILSGRKWNLGAICGWRGQEGGPEPEDVKQRVIWMFPFALNIAELSMYQVIVEHCQHNNTVPAWNGNDAVDVAITKLFDTKSKDDYVICTDFTKFDQHFNHSMQQCAKDVLTGMLSPTPANRDWLDNVFPIKYDIPLLVTENLLYTGPHGMASGSGGTNADETLAHKALQFEAAILSGKQLNPFSMDLGDDGILTYPSIKVEDVIRAYSSHGLEMNEDKQYVSKLDCVYLRRYHHARYRVKGICVGVYSTVRALNRLCEQERYYDPEVWGAEMVALRQLSILENIKWHPLREKFVDYCIKGDKFRLGVDLPGFIESLDKKYDEATAKIPNFLSYTQTFEEVRPSSWWIVSYLKEKFC